MLLPEHEKYHKMGPKDVGLKEPTFIQVSRTTTQTGEQFQFACAVYPEDTREQLKDRLGFLMSIAQDRMEEENKAVVELNRKESEVRHARVLIEKNNRTFTEKAKAVNKLVRRGKKTAKEGADEVAELRAELVKANTEMIETITKAGEAAPIIPEVEDVSVADEPVTDHRSRTRPSGETGLSI